jgi:hypothetical protein
LSQESPDGDWQGVIDGFKSLGTEEGETMAEMVQERGKNRDMAVSANAKDRQEGQEGQKILGGETRNPRPDEAVPDDTPKKSRWLFF